MAPLIRSAQKMNRSYLLIHSNQHFSHEMDQIFFDELELPSPHFNLKITAGSNGNQQIAEILQRLDPILQTEKPQVVFVQGDTNTVLAGALCAQKNGLKVAHVEAGLRSYDRNMPEEINRILADQLSDFLFAVTDAQKKILLDEGISSERIHVVGNTVVDSIHYSLERSQKISLPQAVKIDGSFALLTAHRPSNVDSPQGLAEIFQIVESTPCPVIWPLHPRVRANLKKFSQLNIPSNLILAEPLGHFEFTKLMSLAKFVVTDSGGLQEEACILGVPCITIRENTERPETIHVGSNVLVGRDLRKYQQAIANLPKKWDHPFGDGQTGQRIMSVIDQKMGEST